jgi:hypothetical protein
LLIELSGIWSRTDENKTITKKQKLGETK